MKTIILGKECPTTFDPQKGEVYQPFSYKASQIGVSHKHATITIDDNGDWWLEDRWSTNGTYIREEDGNFRKIGDKEHPGKCRIIPMTFVKLGIDDSTGCCFYARQADSYGNFNEEFEYIQDRVEELKSYEESCKRKIKYTSVALELILPIFIALAIFFVGKQFNVGNNISIGAGIGSGMLVNIVARMMRFVYNPQEKKKAVEKKAKKMKKQFIYCPNPECNHLLSDTDIDLMRCGTCRIKHS